jgi:Flp pilus assembly protein TadD
VEAGRTAFAEQQYGRAELHFRRAIAAVPAEPLAHFLLAQALVALGRYHQAVEAITAGLALRPDWPTVRFRPLALYGTHVADYSEHLATLEAALRRHPNDPVLLFLSGYVLWFDGRRDEAGPLLRRALRFGGPAADIDRFLRALPPAPVI